MTDARTDILAATRRAIGSPAVGRETEASHIPRHYQVTGLLDADARCELFIDRLHDYGALVYRCSESSLPQIISSALEHRAKKSLLKGSDVQPQWLPADFTFLSDEALTYAQLDAAEGILSGCALAIATTGTLVLRHSQGETRRALSLIPDYHLCIVLVSQVVETVPEGIRLMAAFGNAPLTTISGPSATSDIEMTRVKGVHGPRTLDVIVVDGPSSVIR